MRNYRRERNACHVHIADYNEKQIEKHVQYSRDHEEVQRTAGIALSAVNGRTEVIYKRRGTAEKINLEIQRGFVDDVLGRIHKFEHTFGREKSDDTHDKPVYDRQKHRRMRSPRRFFGVIRADRARHNDVRTYRKTDKQVGDKIDANDKAAVENVLNQISATKTQTVDVQAEVEVENPYVTALNGIASGADELSKQLSAEGLIGGGAATLYGTLSSTQGATVKAATVGLSRALASDGSLQRGISLLQSGVGEMGTKLGAGTNELLSGIGTLQKGADSLDSGLGTLTSGASQLNSGAGTLSTGLNTLQSSTGALVSGVEQLDSGAAELNSGMIQFNEEGIEKLVSVFDGDVDSLLDKANELLDASKEYKNFSGIADGMDGSVKFIFVSDK